MRVDNHIYLRHIMLYHFEKGWSAAESFRDLKELFDEGTIGSATVYEWFDRFKSGNTSVDDEPGRERPSEFDDKALLEAVEEDESLTTRMFFSESSCGTHPANFHTLPSFLRWRTIVDWSTLNSFSSILVVRLPSSSTASRSALSSNSDGRPLPGSSSTLVLPDLKRSNHS